MGDAAADGTVICQSLVYAINGRDERLVAAAQGTIMKAHKTFE